MKALYTGRSVAAFGAAAVMLLGTGCATKKHVRQVVAPVEARVGGVEKKTTDHASAIGELENNVSRVDEKAIDAERKAAAAGQSAERAAQSAQQAGMRADQAHQLAESTRSRMEGALENIDNYKLVGTENILFGLNRHALTKEAKAQLDEAVTKVQGAKNYVLEIQGFADKTGGAQNNLVLSQRRADSVVRYLTVNHNVPLRKINVLGIGEDDPNADNKTRDGRKQARRVEIKVFALDLASGPAASGTTATSQE
ncbi:MAG TPA: OmpA family protein [Bryobacteraceae bacterium]|nr:OmpA family protein [Bryobacteraceae bacterium]